MTNFKDVQLWVERIVWLLTGVDEFTWMLVSRRLAQWADRRADE